MNLEALNYFVKVADVKSISKVASSQHISQSALSQMMQKLEDQLEYKLLDRSNKGVQLTKYGEAVYEYAIRIDNTIQKLKEELSCIEHDECNVTMNATWSIANYSLPCLLFAVKNKHTNFNYDLKSNRSETIIENVQNGLSDIGIIYGQTKLQSLHVIPFGTEDIVLVADKDFKIKEDIDLDELLHTNLINFKHGCYNIDVLASIDEFMTNKEDLNFDPLFDLDSISAVKASVSQGFGLAFLPYSSVKKEISDGEYKQIHLENFDLTLDINIIYSNERKIQPQVQVVLDLLQELGPEEMC